MQFSMTVAVTIIRTWTRIYTWGAPTLWAEQRRAEIESDLWEQQQDPDSGATLAATTVALSVLWASSGAAPRIAGCSGAPRKPRVEQVVECVGAFFESSPRATAGTSSAASRYSRLRRR